MDDQLCFVQFIHPGSEHEPDRPSLKLWNTRAHARKFIKVPGRYLHGNDIRPDDLMFWGEWEPESRVIATYSSALPGAPRRLFEPSYIVPPNFTGLQNTDPFVFGERFLYTGCQQNTRRGPTQLRYLARGSVVLFGSCVGLTHFVIDTVLVVDDFIDHSLDDYGKLRTVVPETYDIVTVRPWYAVTTNPRESFRLYFGATPASPVGRMFSFFPCLPYDAGGQGFVRPEIRIDGVITPRLTQGKRLNRQPHVGNAEALWDEVVRQVIAQGLALGVHADLPPRQTSDRA